MTLKANTTEVCDLDDGEVPSQQHGTKEACMPAPRHDEDSGLLDLADLSLEDLSSFDDSVVANLIRDMIDRRRCGTESTERFNQFGSAP
jgi:hypothetical protein